MIHFSVMKLFLNTRLLKQWCIALLFLGLTADCFAQQKTIPFNSPNIYYEGRILYQPDAAVLSWPGTSVNLLFEGSEISAIMQDEDTANYYNVIVDDTVVYKLHTDTLKTCYLLAKGLHHGKHHLQLFKCTEWDKGKTLFFGFATRENTTLLLAPTPKKRRIEFYGNSITCGYAIEDSSGKDSKCGYFENCYLSYAAITARHFDAQFSCISKSGIGLMVSWEKLIMPEMFDRLDPTDSTSKWDFAQYTPDLVVIHLLQNDSWLIKMPKNEQFISRFGTQAPNESTIISCYKNFVATIRTKYPNAYIICVMGNGSITRESSLWPGYVKQALAQLNDPKIFSHFFPYKKTPGHPRIGEQNAMAMDLIRFIENTIQW